MNLERTYQLEVSPIQTTNNQQTEIIQHLQLGMHIIELLLNPNGSEFLVVIQHLRCQHGAEKNQATTERSSDWIATEGSLGQHLLHQTIGASCGFAPG